MATERRRIEGKMPCPDCAGGVSRVLPAHPQASGTGFPRIRECVECYCRFGTIENVTRIYPRKKPIPASMLPQVSRSLPRT